MKPTAPHVRALVWQILAVIALVDPSWAHADSSTDPFYVGAGIGQSYEQISNLEYVSSIHLNAQPLGWKLLAGMRPLPYVGGELEYLDFGRAHYGPSWYLVSADSHDRAGAAFIVGYLPLLDARVDIFAKIGGARYHSSYHFSGNFSSNECVVGPQGICTPVADSASGSTNATGFAYGAGAQYHLGAFAIRAEYERIASTAASESPGISTTSASGLGLVSLGFTWAF